MLGEVFKQLQDSSYMLKTLIQDLLDLAKIDNNSFTLNPERHSLVDNIQQVLSMHLF
jgi:signal transduction histidine kinase